MKCITGTSFRTTMRGIDFCHCADILAVTSNSSVLFLPSLSTTPNDKIMPKHGVQPLFVLGMNLTTFSFLTMKAQSIYLMYKASYLLGSYLEHYDRVTGIDWARNGKSFMSSSKDETVRLYELSLAHSHTTLDMLTGVCGIRCNPFNTSQIAFGTTKGNFFIYDIRKMAVPYLEVKRTFQNCQHCTLFVRI